MYSVLPSEFDFKRATLGPAVWRNAKERTVIFELIRDGYSAVGGALVGEEIGESSFLVSTDDGEREIDELLADLGYCEVRDGLVEEFGLVLEQLRDKNMYVRP